MSLYAINSAEDLEDKQFYNLIAPKRKKVLDAIELYSGVLNSSIKLTNMICNDGDEGFHTSLIYKWHDYEALASILNFAGMFGSHPDVCVLRVDFENGDGINERKCIIMTNYHCCSPD